MVPTYNYLTKSFKVKYLILHLLGHGLGQPATGGVGRDGLGVGGEAAEDAGQLEGGLGDAVEVV